VGIRTYFEGGLTFDLGHRGKDGQQPSHRWTGPKPPLQLARVAMPPWRFGICIPANISPLTHQQERQVFASKVPVAEADVHSTLWIALAGVFASATEHDHDIFCSSVDALQESMWKRAEWKAHGQYLKEISQELRAAGARGVGLSSMGPALFFSAKTFERDRLPRELNQMIMYTLPANSGRRITTHETVAA
jgi:beta-ribofuranosylaminobenzene 5'-phosphate synthase